MKKVLLILSMVALITAVSCGDDDEVQIGLTGTVNFDGTTTTISNGLFGELSQQGFYSGFFFLSDGNLSFNSQVEQAASEGELLITVSIFAPGDSFQPGEYSMDLSGNQGAIVAVLNEENTSAGGAIATGGTINVTGSGNTYTIVFNLEFENDITLTGTVTGGFEVVSLTGG